MMSSNVLEELRRKAIKNFMDVLVLTEMKKSPLSGYDVISFIHRKYGVLASSGTIYSLLYSLERDGLIRGAWNQRKRVYSLTDKGEQNIRLIAKANEELQDFLRNVSLVNATRR